MDWTNALYIALKERRFTTTARVLGEEKAIGAKVRIMPSGQHAAWWDAGTRTITLNDGMPQPKNAKEALIWERAKLYHELFHVMFTTGEKLRGELYKKSKDGNRYLWVSNVLEDGRIEYHGCKQYEGTQWYIRTLLAQLVREKSPDSGLLIYVRTKLWRNAEEGKFWSKFQHLIDEAITAPTSETAWRNAAVIVDAMFTPKPKVCTCPDCGAPMPDLSHARLNMAMSVCATCGATSSDDGGGDGGGDGGNGTPTDDGDDTGTPSPTNDGDIDDGATQSPEDGDSDTDGGGAGNSGGDEDKDDTGDPSALPDPNAPTDKDVEKELDDMVEDAKNQIDQEVEDELVQLDNEAESYVQEQEYIDPVEEQSARELTDVFSSLLVESERQKYVLCKIGARLDTRRLIETQTGGDFMQEPIEKLSQPHIVLLVDESSSMRHLEYYVSSAARILNGAIQASGSDSVAISFGGAWANFVPMKIIPKTGFSCNGGSTPTGRGLNAAHQWLNQQNATRGMVIVLTDGHPSWRKDAMLEFNSLAEEGYFVLNVLLGGLKGDANMLEMCHRFISIKDIAKLVRVIEEPLGEFLSGAF